MFSGSNNIMVLGGTFHDTHVQESPSSVGFQQLLQAASPSAFHNSGDRFDPPKCHPKTRLKVLEKISNWIDGTEHQNESVMWVNGGAGVGKSAIAQTMAERLAEEKRLVASFFFSRTDPSRNDANRLVPTIAYHTILHIPDLKDPIIHAVARNPLVFKLSMDAQFSTLLTEPVCDLAGSGYFQFHSSPRVIIIDGLDECSAPGAQVDILNAVANALRKARFPLLFLLASRPEHHLSIAFASKSFNGLLTSLTLDDSFFPEHDIRFFLEDQFEELKESHPFRAYLPSSWPDPAAIQTLISKSSGQFIYASTVIKFISSSRHRPNHRLDVILGLRPPRNESPFFELDALYTHIFSSLDVEVVQRVLDILALQFLEFARTVAEIEEFLTLEAGDVQIALCDLASVISLEENDKGSFVKVLHASLSDFLKDRSRSKAFYIEPRLRHTVFAVRYLEIFRTPGFRRPFFWYYELPAVFLDAVMIPTLQRLIFDFSLLSISANCDEDDEKSKGDIITFMELSSNFLWCRPDQPYDHLRNVFDEYLLAYLGNYYSDPCHTFLVALVGIGASYAHELCNGDSLQIHDDIKHLFGASHSLDNKNLYLFRSLSHEVAQSFYGRHLRSFVNDSSRSRACALNGERYAIAALYCLKFLCDEKSAVPPRKHDPREKRIHVNRPWIWRRIIGPNARTLTRYKRQYWKRTQSQASLRYPKLQQGLDDYCHSRGYLWALQCFRKLLKRSASSKELFGFASRRSLASPSQDWPRQARLTRDAINRYVDFCEVEK